MKPCVVDASVAIKWYIPEVHHENAVRLLKLQRAGDAMFHAPDLFLAEAGNILCKKVRIREISTNEAHEIARALIRVPVVLHPAGKLLSAALDLAFATGAMVYDSLNMALAAALDCEMITADERLIRSAERSELHTLMRWVGTY